MLCFKNVFFTFVLVIHFIYNNFLTFLLEHQKPNNLVTFVYGIKSSKIDSSYLLTKS